MSSPSATSSNQSPIHHARNAGALPEGGRVPPNHGDGHSDEIEESSDPHDLDSGSRRASQGPSEVTGGPDDQTPQGQQAPKAKPRSCWRPISLPTVFGFLYLTFNSGMAIYQSRGDVAAIASHVSTYLNIAGIFICLKLFRRAPANSNWRDTLRAGIWVLTVSLTFGYVYQVTVTTKPTLQMAMLQWAMPATIGTAAFIVFFQKDRSESSNPTTTPEDLC